MERNIEDLEKEITGLSLTGPLTEHLTRGTRRGFPSSNEASMDPGIIKYISRYPQEPEPQPEPPPEPVLRSEWNPEPRPPDDVVKELLKQAKEPLDISKVKFESDTRAHKKFKKNLERYNKKRETIKKKRSSTPKLTRRGLDPGLDRGLEQLMDENQGLRIDRDITAIELLLDLRKMSLGK